MTAPSSVLLPGPLACLLILAGCTPPPASTRAAQASPAPDSLAPSAANPAADTAASSDATAGYGAVPKTRDPPYVFAWPFIRTEGMSPRGGTTRGSAVALIAGPSPAWTRLRSAGPSAFERDRAAILAMAGDYRASFDFIETTVFTPPDTPGREPRPARPYRSWGTERVYMVEDRRDFISLQHLMVMFFEDEKGNRQGPMVMKHWRQDWRYEPASLIEYRGRDTWARRKTGTSERKGAWSQAVYHVDDSPRYGSLGRWEHNASFSAWTGGLTRRPLPRREHTVRSDYHTLEARNRHTILPAGWLHEQDNLKLVLDSAGAPDASAPYRAREVGVDRYDLIQGFDFSAGDGYWKKTGPFWAEVRARWEKTLSGGQSVRVSETCRGEPAFAAFFALAESAAGPNPPSPAALGRSLDSLFTCILAAPADR